MPKEFIKRFSLRFVGKRDEKVYNKLVDSAAKNHRSINNETTYILELYFENEEEIKKLIEDKLK